MTAFASQVSLLFTGKILETLRAPAWLIVGLSTPLLYLALFAPVLEPLAGGPGFADGDVLDVFLPGVLVIIAFGAGMGAGWIVIEELNTRACSSACGSPRRAGSRCCSARSCATS